MGRDQAYIVSELVQFTTYRRSFSGYIYGCVNTVVFLVTLF